MAWMLSLEDLVQGVQGKLLSQLKNSFSGVGSDTRQDLKGKIFFALKGDNFDAHHFLESAFESGASVLVVHEDVSESIKECVTVIKVSDTLVALQNLACYWRRRCGFKVVGITGSNGKTTTKQFTMQVLEQFRRVYGSRGSFNNHWGVPLTLLEAPQDCEIVICEMGMNHKGELTRLVEIAEPDIVICLNVGRAHLEFFPTLQDVADAKEEIYQNSLTQVGVFNLDNSFTKKMRGRWLDKGMSLMTFSEKDTACDVSFKVNGKGVESLKLEGVIGRAQGSCDVNVFGYHNGQNLMAASTLALALGLTGEEIWQGLRKCQSHWGRNQVLVYKDVQIVFDAYNANPESMGVLFENLNNTPRKGKKRLAILGEMLEMGSEAGAVHEETGELAGVSVEEIWFIGSCSQSFIKGLGKVGFQGDVFCSDSFLEDKALEYKDRLQDFELVVLKGSRGKKLEQVLKAWGMSDDLGMKE